MATDDALTRPWLPNPTDGLIDTAAVFGFDVALVPARHPGARPTGTEWPA